jgi:hypothetical protein
MAEVLRIYDPITQEFSYCTHPLLFQGRSWRMKRALRAFRANSGKELKAAKGELAKDPVWNARDRMYEQPVHPDDVLEKVFFEAIIKAIDEDSIDATMHSLVINDAGVRGLLQSYAKEFGLDYFSMDDLLVLGTALTFDTDEEPEYWETRPPYTAVLVPEWPPSVLIEWESRLENHEREGLYQLWREWYACSEYRMIEGDPRVRILPWEKWKEEKEVDHGEPERPGLLAAICFPLNWDATSKAFHDEVLVADFELNPDYERRKGKEIDEWKMAIKRLYSKESMYNKMVEEMLVSMVQFVDELLAQGGDFKTKRSNVLKGINEKIQANLLGCKTCLERQSKVRAELLGTRNKWLKETEAISGRYLSSRHLVKRVGVDTIHREKLSQLRDIDVMLAAHYSDLGTINAELDNLEKELRDFYLLRSELNELTTADSLKKRRSVLDNGEGTSPCVKNLMFFEAEMLIIRGLAGANLAQLHRTYELDFTDRWDREEGAQVLYQEISGNTQELKGHVNNARKMRVPPLSDDYLWDKYGPEEPNFEEEHGTQAGFSLEFLHRVFNVQEPK